MSQATCATCPYFVPREGIAGWCNAFDHQARHHHTRTQDCDNHIESEKIEVQPVREVRKSFPWVSFRNIISVAVSIPLVVIPSPTKVAAIPQPADPICERGSGRFTQPVDKADVLLDDDAWYWFVEGESDAVTGNPPRCPDNNYYMTGFNGAKHQLSSGHISWQWEGNEFEPVGEYEF